MDQDAARVLAFVKERIQADIRANAPRRARDRADLRHLQVYRGGEENHWSVWDQNTDNYVPRPTDTSDAALPAWFFRATTNLFAVKTDGVCSILNQSQPAQELSPSKDSDAARAAAEVAEAALPQLYEECGYPSTRPQLHKLIALTHGAALHVYYDTDERHGMDELPLLQCQACQQFFLPHEVPDGAPCPACEAPPEQVTDAMHPPMSPQAGFPVTHPMPKGKMCTRLLSSFEFSIPRSATQFHEERIPWIAGHGRMDQAEIDALWGPSEHKEPEQVSRAATGSAQSVQYADRMRGLSSPTGDGQDQRGGGSTATVAPSGPVVWMVWSDPVDDGTFYFPDGLYAVVIDDAEVKECGPLPIVDEQGRPVKNVLLRTYQAAPGSPWGKPPADDMEPLQRQLNLVLALAFLILMQDAAPTTYLPDTVTLLDELSGMPGSTVRFQSLRAGDKPIISGGQGFPESLKWFIEFIVNQFDVVSKLNAVLMGARPEGGDPTAFEVNVLQERGMAAFREPLDELVDFEKRLSRLLLRTAKQSAWSPRFYSVRGDSGAWEVESFLGMDLSGDVTIHVDPMSAWPRSSVTQNLRLDNAIERGILNPQDPEVQAEYLSLNDLAAFKESVDKDRAQVSRELDIWRKATDPGQIPPPDQLWNLPFHFFQKVQWLKTEEADTARAERPLVYQAIRMQVMQIQFLMTPQAPPAPGPGQPGGPPPDGSAIDAATGQGAMAPARPKNAPPDGTTLDSALSAGAITPAPAQGKP